MLALVPRLWTETIEGHRHEVRRAILQTTARLVADHGLLAVTMSQIAEEAGIGRATLYKYFPDVEAILLAWHEGQISAHLDQLAELRDRSDGASSRLHAVLEAYALISHETRGHRHGDLGALLHRNGQLTEAQRQLHDLIRDLVAEGTAAGTIRDDVPAAELAHYCLHALGGASSLPSKAAVRRLVIITLAGLNPGGAGPANTSS